MARVATVAVIVVLLGCAAAATAQRHDMAPQISAAEQCWRGMQAAEENEVIVDFYEDNAGCDQGDCNEDLAAMQRQCAFIRPLGGQVCHTTWSAVDGNGTSHAWTEFACVPRMCAEPNARSLEVAKLEAGWREASARVSCSDSSSVQAQGGLDLVFQLLCVGGMLCFAAHEKNRRWGRMSGMWPVAPGRATGSLRTTLCGCWPWVSGSSCGHCCSHWCCFGVMTVMNAAEISDRAFQWPDICCACGPGVCTTAYHTRQAIRARLDAKPSPCLDCLSIACCLPCSVAQHTQEIEKGLPPHLAPGALASSGAASVTVASGQPVQYVAAGMPVVAAPGAYPHAGPTGMAPSVLPAASAPGAYPAVSQAYPASSQGYTAGGYGGGGGGSYGIEMR